MKESTLLLSQKLKHIHFIGIGGISMSGLAEILLSMGYKVSGSDIKVSNITKKLEKMGAKIYPFHSEENIINPDLVVYTAAVREDNPERIKAVRLNIPTIERAVLLGEIMKKYPYSIAISGTHGKTTTTSMVSMIMLEAELDPTIHIGGELDAIGGNTKIGGSRYFIAEACEYVESFLKFHPYLAIVLNIELDHVDYFKDIEHIKASFLKFASLIPLDGYLVVCADDSNASSLLDKVDCKKITYGVNSQNAMYRAKNIVFDNFGCASYTLIYNNEPVSIIKLSVPGIHNVSNSLAAAASCLAIGCRLDSIKYGLSKFTGTHKRFETKGIIDDIKVIDDYAHHPSEIRATLKAAKQCTHTRIWCIFQPHTYTRTKAFINEFADSFEDADNVIVCDIYAAREKDTGEIHSRVLADKINAVEPKAIYIKSFQNIVDYLLKNAAPGALILTMGAGDISKVGEMFLNSRSVLTAVNK